MNPTTAAGGNTKGAAAPDGLIEAALRYVGSITRHLTGLAGLAKIEAQDVAETYLKIAVFLIAGLVFGIFGYIFLVLFLAFLVGSWFGISWVWITLALAGMHIALAGICAWNIRENFHKPVFPATGAEIRRDISVLSGQPGFPPAPAPVISPAHPPHV